jgi:hypothetical protein
MVTTMAFLQYYLKSSTKRGWEMSSLLVAIQFQNRFGRFDIFQNKSCFNAFLAWYESSTITEKDFKRIMLIEKNNSLGIKSPINASSNMLEEWWLGTNGHLY